MMKGMASHSCCLLCKQPSQDLICIHCETDLPIFDVVSCHHDLRHIPYIAKGLAKTLGKLEFDRLLALAEYQWPYSSLLTALKFSRATINSAALAQLMVKHVLTGPLPQAIIPIPLHWWRLYRRQYNQTSEIAKHLSDTLQLTIRTDVLKRARRTFAQSQLGLRARKQNLKGAFFAKALPELSHVALIDDVITTGATMQAAAKALQAQNPQLRLQLWAVCITPERR